DELPSGRGAVTLRDWVVPTVSLDPDAALGYLRAEVPDELTPGATLRHLREVAAFAEDLVSRGRLLPVVLPASGPSPALPSSAWRPVLAAADSRWAQALALALPPAGRAAGGADLVGGALDALVDASARSVLGNVTALPGGSFDAASAGKRASAGTAWRSFVGALTGTRRAFKASPADVTTLAEAL